MKTTTPHRPRTPALATLALALLASAMPAAAPAPAANTAITPVPRDANWVKRHEFFVDIANRQTGCQVLFLGDSITDLWRDRALGLWTKHFAQYDPVNFGISGDRTQHLLWRLQNGELGKLRPKALVLMIGTNNTGYETDKKTKRNTPAETAAGVKAILDLLREKLPAAKILLLAVFPRAQPGDPQRAEVDQINTLISKFDDAKSIFYLDIGPRFLRPDGTLPTDIMPDLLHPNWQGYQIWADAIKTPLENLVK